MANPRIAEYWKATQIKKGEVRNQTGQPRKWISAVNFELEQKGFNPATKQDIEANYMSMMQLWEQDLKDLMNNKDKPMFVRILAKNMLGGKWFDIIEKMLDRWIWKATISQEITWKDWKDLFWDVQITINQKKIIAKRFLKNMQDTENEK